MNCVEKVKSAFRMLTICMANGITYEDSYFAVKQAYRLSWCDAQVLSRYTDDLFALNYIRQKLISLEECEQTPEWFFEIIQLKNRRDEFVKNLEQIMLASPFYRGNDPISVMRALSSVLPKY